MASSTAAGDVLVAYTSVLYTLGRSSSYLIAGSITVALNACAKCIAQAAPCEPLQPVEVA
jgi:sulfite exporter TauE/SafE